MHTLSISSSLLYIQQSYTYRAVLHKNSCNKKCVICRAVGCVTLSQKSRALQITHLNSWEEESVICRALDLCDLVASLQEGYRAGGGTEPPL